MLYPVNMQVTGKLCLVIGGGHVALRKVSGLLACGAKVRVISPLVTDNLKEMAKTGSIELKERGYQRGDLAGAFLVFAATDNLEVQERVAAEATAQGTPLNIVDDPERCDFQVPAQVRRGKLLLTVSTGGASPALSKMIRQQLEGQFDDAYDTVARLLAAIRKVIVMPEGDSDANRLLFTRLLERGLIDIVRDWRRTELLELLGEELPKSVDVNDLLAAIENGSGRQEQTDMKTEDSANDT